MTGKNLTAAAVLATLMWISASAQTVPFITKNTVRVSVPGDTEIEAVSEGVVTLKSNYNKLGFYNLEAELLFPGSFTYMPAGRYGDKTQMSGGACAVKTEGGFGILHPDGSLLTLPGFRSLGAFRDGVAAGRNSDGAIFINAQGQSVYGAFLAEGKVYGEPEVRPGSDGLRALYADKWGYVDARGNVVIGRKYGKVTDFSEGYAFAAASGSDYVIIDRKGNPVTAGSVDTGWKTPREFRCGWAYLPGKRCFVNPGGEMSPEADALTDFYKDRALVKSGYDTFSIIDTKFGVVKTLEAGQSLMVFGGAPTAFCGGLYLLDAYGANYVFDYNGDLKLKAEGTCFFTGIYEGGMLTLQMDVTASGNEKRDAVAVCKPDGEIVVIFDKSGKYTHIRSATPRPGPQPVTPPVTPPVDPPVDPPHNQTQGGTSAVNTLKEITIIYDEPFSGSRKADIYANIAIGGEIHKGDSLRLGVIPGEKKASAVRATVKCGTANARPMELAGPGLFAAKLAAGDARVEVHIGMAEEPEIPGKWVLGGHRDFSRLADSDVENMEADICLMTDPEGIKGTPLGEDVKGLFVVDFDPRKRITVFWNGKKDQPVKDFATYFWGPSRVEGFYEVDGTKYIYMNGGPHAVGNWMQYGKDDERGLLVSLLVSLSNTNLDHTGGDPTYVMMMLPHRYRLSYADLPDGGMRLGRLERFSVEYGWVPSNDKRLIKKKSRSAGMFVTIHEVSEVPVDPGILDGVVLRKMPKPSAPPAFYPGRNWFGDDAQYKHTVGVFNRMYGVSGAGERPFTQEEQRQFILGILERWKMKKVR